MPGAPVPGAPVKVAVTGASGFVGSSIAAQLAECGHQVRLLLRATSSRRFLPEAPWEVVEGDITQPSSLYPFLEGADVVIHAAGLVKARRKEEFDAVNAVGVENLLAAAAQSPGLSRFVYLSSLAAHGPSPGGSPRPLTAAAAPVSAYGSSKARGETAVENSPLAGRSVTLRLPVVYGPNDLALLPFFQLVQRRVAPLLWGGRNVLSIIYIRDAARAATALATTGAPVGGKTYTADDGNHYSWRQLLSHIEATLDRKALLLPMPLWAYQSAALISQAYGALAGKAVPLSPDKVTEMRQPYWISDNRAIEADLGWRPQVSFSQGAGITAAWYKEQRLL